MIRYVIILALLMVLYLLIRSAIKELRSRSHPAVPSKDQMIQDPVCRVYVPRGSAVEATIGGQPYFFCSHDCAKQFESRLKA
jgi:YHS domain-containing protein